MQLGDSVFREVSLIRGKVTEIRSDYFVIEWPSGMRSFIEINEPGFVTVPKGFKPVITFIRE